MKGKFYLGTFLVFFLILSFISTQMTSADGTSIIEGKVLNGSPGGDVPNGLMVTLHVFNSQGGLETKTTTTDGHGNFSFMEVTSDQIQAYIVSTVYRGVTYREDWSSSLGEFPLALQIFDTTHDISILSVDSHIWLIKTVDSSLRQITALEIVLITNGDELTFQPRLDDPESMNFLRFSVPVESHNLEVQADLLGGGVIDVGTGFGMTAPVLPGSHQIVFTYELPYSGDGMDVVRSFPQGVTTFRVLMPEHLGRMQGSELLALKESALIGGVSYNVWEISFLKSGADLAITLTGLPQPTVWQNVKSGIINAKFLQVIIPTILGLSLVAMLFYGVVRQRGSKWLEATQDNPADRMFRRVEGLLRETALLDDLFEECKIPEKQYRHKRATLKASIADILTSHEDSLYLGGTD